MGNQMKMSTNEGGPSLVGLVVPEQDIFCSALAALVGPVHIYFSSPYTIVYFTSFVPIAQQAGQAAVLGRLSLSICLWPGLSDFKGRHRLTKMKI
jgi:hypothetical protein